MASETEQLNLVVQLTDNASGGLARLRGELNNVGSGQQVAHLQRFKQELGAVHKITHGLAEEFIGLSRSVPVVGRELSLGLTGLMGTLGPVGLGFAALGGAIAAVALEVNKFAGELRAMHNLSGSLGIEPATLKVFQDQARAVGVSAEVVTSSLQGMKRSMSELYKPGFGALGESLLTKMARGEGLETRRFLEDLKSMTDEDRFNAIVQKANNVFQNELNDTRSKLRPEGDKGSAAALRAQFLAEFGIDEQMTELKNVTAMTKEQAKEFNSRTDAATEARLAQGELATELHRLNEELFASVAAMNALTGVVDSVTGAIKHVSPANMPGWAVRLFQYTIPGVGPPLAMYDLYKFLRSLYGAEPKGAATEPQGLLGGMMGATGASDKAVAENTAELKRLNDVLVLATTGTGAGGGAGDGGGAGGGMMRGLGGLPGFDSGGGPYGSSVGPGTGPGADSSAPGGLGFPSSLIAGEGAESIESAIGGGFARAGATPGSVAPMTTGDIRSALEPSESPGVPAGDVGATPGQADRPGHYSGTVEVGGKTFHFGTGGMGRGSLPYGNYNIDLGPTGIGDVGRRIGAIGGITSNERGNEIADPKYPGHPREGIEIHPASGADLDHLYTEGCFGVEAHEWPAFKAALLEAARTAPGGRLRINVQPGAHGATARIGPPGTAQRLGIAPILPGTGGAAAASRMAAGAGQFPGGQPEGLIIHYTGGIQHATGEQYARMAAGGDPYMTKYHAQLFMDEHGNITRIVPPGQTTWHAGPANAWAEGMEIATKYGGTNPNLKGSGINAEQRAALEKYYQAERAAGHYPRGAYGHSEVMPPPHRENEGEFEARQLRESDRAAIDERAKQGDVKVEVNGKLTANVRAPKNTDVSVEGGGAFKSTETNRSMPAEAPSGI